jgi:hypothetical protein
MAKIDVTLGFAWTTFHVWGETCREDIIAAVDTYFPKLIFTDVIWDLSGANISTMSRADFEAIAQATKAHEAVRGQTKTVFVTSNPETFALICMYTGLAAMTELAVDYSAFNKLEHAEQWLVCNRTHGCRRPGDGTRLHQCAGAACHELRFFQAARKENKVVPIATYTS